MREVIDMFGELDGRVVTQPNDYRASAAGAAQWLGGVYREVLARSASARCRKGRRRRPLASRLRQGTASRTF